MPQIFKTHTFDRAQRALGLSDFDLQGAVWEMRQGLFDADLGAGLLKKRLSLASRGKQGGARVIVVTNKRDRWIFIYAFKKASRSDISKRELVALKQLAQVLLAFSEQDLDKAVQTGEMKRIGSGSENQEI